MKRLRIREEARAELLHETQYYETKRAGTGKRFREAVSASISLVRRFPAGGAPGPAHTRKTKVKGFPFAVVYRDDPSDHRLRNRARSPAAGLLAVKSN